VVDLSIVAAIYYTGPIFILIFSVLFLREAVSRQQVIAVGVAFFGVLVVLQPTGEDFAWAMLVPLVSALCYAVAAVITRGRSNIVDPWALTLSLNIVFALVGAAGMLAVLLVGEDQRFPFLLTVWAPLDGDAVVSLTILAVASIGIHLFLARAYQLGPMPVIAGLDFSYLGFAVLWGLVILGTIPSWTTILGMTLIGIAGYWCVARQANA
ncbi:MAG: DMT family transporter, partial [Pseudomonadota bacterium]